MLDKQIQNLKNYLAYVIYMKMYGLTDKPFEQVEVYLSEANNDWNAEALSVNEIEGLVESSPQKEMEGASISDSDNAWNKEAISRL